MGKQEGILHENEAAEILYRISADIHMHGSDIKEGKIELIADCDGVLKIRRDALLAVNSLGEMMIASRHGDFPVKKGDKIAGTRIIPLVIEKPKWIRQRKWPEQNRFFPSFRTVLKKLESLRPEAKYKRTDQRYFHSSLERKT